MISKTPNWRPEEITFDNVQVFEWHPTDPAVLVAGLANGQLVDIDNHNLLLFHYYHLFFPILHLHPQVLWDLSPHLNGLEKGACTWDHRYLMCF